ncbi:MAG: hypothetical protein J6S36_03680 [Eggerthellaceae bacterium]|nr:hypothetical protein [Eggerthellaceae bacterium]
MNELHISLHVEPDSDAALHVDEGADLALCMSEQFVVGEGIPYAGPYEITPTTYEQVLTTRSKRMTDDVTVFEIPYHQTTNQAGGYTVSIAS